MTESIVKVANAATVSRDGTGSAKKERNGKHSCHNDEHDMVTISSEARRRSAAHADEDALSSF